MSSWSSARDGEASCQRSCCNSSRFPRRAAQDTTPDRRFGQDSHRPCSIMLVSARLCLHAPRLGGWTTALRADDRQEPHHHHRAIGATGSCRFRRAAASVYCSTVVDHRGAEWTSTHRAAADATRRHTHTLLHARRDASDGQVGRPRRPEERRRSDDPGQHVSPAAAPRSGDRRRARWPAPLHGLGWPDSDRLGRLPSLESGPPAAH